MKVVVTGASGFLGKNFLLRSPREWHLTALYFRSSGFLDFLSEQNLTHVIPIRCDLTQPAEVKKSLGKLDVDFVIYFAANADPSYSMQRPYEDLSQNTIALIHFLNSCTCKKLVYLSSGGVYEGLEGLVNPGRALDPTLPYAISKLACEQYVKFFHKKGKIENYVILRFFGAYGPYEPKRKIFTRLINAFAFQGADEFKVIGDGDNLIDAMYIDDAVSGILKVLYSDHVNLTVDFASGDPVFINELVGRVARILGKDSVQITHQDHTAEYIKFFVSTQEMKSLFDFKTSIPLEEGIIMLLDHLNQEKHGGSRIGER